VELRAQPDRCEEASHLSKQSYIPCNAPAVRVVFHKRDNYAYRMCAPCADHNIRNRGGEDRGPYQPQDSQMNAPAPTTFNPKTWDWYEAAWTAIAHGKPIPPIHDGEPHTSACRVSLYKGGPFLPIQYWYGNNNALCVQLNGITIAPDMPFNLIVGPNNSRPFVGNHTALSIWPFAAKNPISDEMLDFWKMHARWPDSSPAVHDATNTVVEERTSRAVEADNRPPPTPQYTEGTYDWAKAKMTPIIEEAQRYLKAGRARTKEEADRAAQCVGVLHAFHKIKAVDHARGDPRITTEMKEQINAWKKIGAEWTDLRAATGIWEALKRDYIGPWSLEQDAIAKATPPNSRDGEPAKPLQAGGGAANTRTIHVQERPTARMVDYGKVIETIALEVPIIEAAQAFCDAAARKGVVIPGCEIVMEKSVV
jgi:hypothetical protein